MAVDIQVPVSLQSDGRMSFIHCSFSTDSTVKDGASLLRARLQGPKVDRVKTYGLIRHSESVPGEQSDAGRKPRRRYVVGNTRKTTHRAADSSGPDGRTGREAACNKLTATSLSPGPRIWPNCSEELRSLFVSGCVESASARGDQSRLECLIWFRHLPALSVRGKVAGVSARALVVVAFGRAAHDDRLLHQATSVYVDALTPLNQELTSPSEGKILNTLTACLNLIAYGLYMNDIADFSAHVAGMTCVMLACGPDAFREGEGEMHKIFLACRQYLIYGALCARVKTFLGDQTWLVLIPEEEKTAYERLLDVMTQLPGLRCQFVRLQSEVIASKQSRSRRMLIDQMWHLRAALLRWHGLYAPSIRTTKQTPEPGGAGSDTSRQLPAQHHTLASFSDAITMTLYWACLVEIHNFLGQCYDALGLSETICMIPNTSAPTVSTTPPTSSPSHRMSPFRAAVRFRATAMTHAKDICSSIRYFTSNRPNAFSLVHLMAPLKMALRCFVLNLPASAEYLEWTHETLGVLQSTGVGIVEGLMVDKGVY